MHERKGVVMKKMYGIVCANITPMTAKGEIDHDSLRSLVDHLAEQGIHGVYPTGTNGESVLVSKEEQHEITDTVIDANRGRMLCYIQCGTLDWKTTMENVAYACEAGADGVGVMTPIFFKADDIAMADYYREACQAANGKQVYLYNISKYTNNDISVKAFAQIMDENPNAMGIKYSNTDLGKLGEYLRVKTQRKPEALIGSDSLMNAALAIGCTGAISGPAAVFAKRHIKAYEYFMSGDMEKAQIYQQRICENSKLIKPVPAIPGLKAMLKMKGVIKDDTCRRPFRPLTLDEYHILERALDIYEKEEDI